MFCNTGNITIWNVPMDMAVEDDNQQQNDTSSTTDAARARYRLNHIMYRTILYLFTFMLMYTHQ